MCGFLFTHFKANAPKEFHSKFKESLHLQSYRGLDDSGITQFSNSFFGHVRLAIIDLTSKSCQPVEDNENILLFNGEIFNFQNFEPESTSDVKTLFSQLRLQKETYLSKIEGFFSLLFFSKTSSSFFLARDFFGEKPLYYYNDEDVFIASSTIKSLVSQINFCVSNPINIDATAIKEYLLFGFIREPKTIYENIFSLPAGHIISLSGNKLNLNQIESNSETYSKQHWKGFIKEAISTADVPAHLLLSSGVDSTYLLAEASKLNLAPEVFIYRNKVEKERDESIKALVNVKKIDASIKSHIISNEEDPSTLYDQFINLLEQPTNDGLDIFNILKGVRRKSTEAKLVLTGLGGDEMFGGYPTFSNYGLYKALQLIPTPLIPQKLKRFKIKLNREKEFPVLAYYFKYRLEPNSEILFEQSTINNLFEKFVKHIRSRIEGHRSPIEKIKILETFDYMLNQLLRDADNISMKMGIEIRNPFLFIPLMQQKPDSKTWLKKHLYKNHKISFGSKKGFSLGESKEALIPFFLSEIKSLEKRYSKLIESLNLKQSPSQARSFALLKKWYILLKWLDINLKLSE